MEDYPHKQLTEKIIGAGIKVHKYLGSGYLEKVYERSLAIELQSQGYNIECQKEVQVFYYSNLVGTYVTDMIVDRKVLIELKAIKEISNSHVAQTLNYLKSSGLDVGLILNFSREKLEIRRVVYNSNYGF